MYTCNCHIVEETLLSYHIELLIMLLHFSTKSFDCHLFCFCCTLSLRFYLDKFRIGTYPGNVNASNVLDQLWHLVDNREHLASQLGGTDIALSTGHHRYLPGLRERSSHFGGNLQGKKSNTLAIPTETVSSA